MKKIKIFFFSFLFLFSAGGASAHQPEIIYNSSGNIQINNPEISQAFYDELIGSPRNYFINSGSNFELYLNILVPQITNPNGIYSANVYRINPPAGGGKEELIFSLDGTSQKWEQFWEDFGRDYYLKGPEFDQQVPAGNYKIEVFSNDPLLSEASNTGKYILAVGKKESFDIKSLLNVYWQIPQLKLEFFKSSIWQFFLTPFGIAGVVAIGILLTFLAFINYLIGVIRLKIEQGRNRTIFLTSAGMQVKDEIIKLLQKPAYDVNVAFVTTASKPEPDKSFVKKDLDSMKEAGFNVQEIDIEGKTEKELMKLFEPKDIIFVEGGNTFYLLKAMRKCRFEKVINKMLKKGKVYIGASAGSMVAGRTIETANWKHADRNIVGLKNLRGLNLVPFNVFVHYQPEHAELIKQKIKSKWKRKKLKILTDSQAILVQGKNVLLLGQGEKIII